jgi:hypothetical protein
VLIKDLCCKKQELSTVYYRKIQGNEGHLTNQQACSGRYLLDGVAVMVR